jgi:ABC-type amino acid transport substrate-binding protein
MFGIFSIIPEDVEKGSSGFIYTKTAKWRTTMFKACLKLIILTSITLLFGSYAGAQDSVAKPAVLHVGVAPDYPPIIFKLNGQITGAEADLAKMLAKEINRSVQFVELGWDELIPALMEQKIDIIMSGMTITEARRVRIDFTDHYLKSGLLTLIRTEDASKYNSVKSIKENYVTIGVVAGTTGEAFVRKTFPLARVVTFAKASSAPFEIRNRRIDMFINDAPSIIWLASENEADLTGVWILLNTEYLGWGVRRGDQQFLDQVNSVLGVWRKNGTLKQVLVKWMPYLKRSDLSGMIE